jgi:hypothetical protein
MGHGSFQVRRPIFRLLKKTGISVKDLPKAGVTRAPLSDDEPAGV